MSKEKFAFDKTNFILLGIGMAVVIIGFLLMTGPVSTPTTFEPDIFSVRRIKVAPVVCLLGFVFMIYAVLRKPEKAVVQRSKLSDVDYTDDADWNIRNPCHLRYLRLKNNQKESSNRASGQPLRQLKNLKNLNKLEWFEALILGLIQGLTEYLPVSSSGHLAIGSALFGIEGEENLAFTIVVHVATVFSTLVILWKEIDWIFKGLFKWQMNEETRYVINILVSMIPIGIVGVFFKDEVEAIFGSGLVVVGCCLLLTALLLSFSYYYKPKQKENISMKDAFIIGLAQACAVLPGLSRSGSTIATGLLLGDNKAKLAQFSFLMVMPPILGEALLDGMKMMKGEAVAGDIPTLSLVVGFLAAFVSGCLACKWMINIVKKGKLIYFAIYCAIAGVITLILS